MGVLGKLERFNSPDLTILLTLC